MTRRNVWFTLRLAVCVVGGLIWTSSTTAQSGGKFEITRSTLDAGGSTERSPDNVVVRGSIGQPDVGVAAAGSYYLTGGFWSTQGNIGIFSDGFESGDTSAWSGTVGAFAPAQASVATESPIQRQAVLLSAPDHRGAVDTPAQQGTVIQQGAR
ncbi:MAG: hypothetical protein MPN21_20080 [Thermoanaerobaculia bacterium]|nr:hypothetical protein [Thermoanaerobaculia bacterium]